MQLKHSCVMQLKRRCLELEEVAGPKHSAKVRDLLEKERAVQAKVSQIAGLKSQLLQKGSSKQVTPSSHPLHCFSCSGLNPKP